MGTTTNSSQAAAAPKRRSRSLSGFTRQEMLKNTDEMAARSSLEEAARIQKAAAWQWYLRGVGEAVALGPTKPPLGSSQADIASDDARCMIGVSGSRSIRGGKANVWNCNVSHNKIVEPPLAEFYRAASRFKAEAAGLLTSTRPAANERVPPSVSAPPAPSGCPSTPLYDELELSNLRNHMADFVQRLQRQQTPNNHKQSSPAIDDPGKSRLPASTDHHETKAPPPVAVAFSGDHQATATLQPPRPAPVASITPFRIRMFFALQKLFRKVLSESVPKCTKNSSQITDPATPIYEPAEVLYDNAHVHANSTTQSHHHHYIHHHHHHYHTSESPEEGASIILSRRRNSESGISLPCTPSLVDAGSDQEEEDEAEENRIVAYLARRRRRYSDCFRKYQLQPERNAGFAKYERVKEDLLPRRYKSERFLPNKIPTMEDEFDEDAFRRRNSAEVCRKEPNSLELRTDGKREGGAYRLGGAGVSCGKPASTPRDRRRHAESSKMRAEAGQKQRGRLPGKPMY